MRKFLLTLALGILIAQPALAREGMINVASAHSVATTADRLVQALQRKGMTVFERINHAAGAEKVGQKLPPTELVIFGNPKVGTPLMLCSRSIAIDLPQKALIWQDYSGEVWLSYNDPSFLALRHDTRGCDAVLKKVGNALQNFARAATSAN